MNNLVVRVPATMRDSDGVRLDSMLAGVGAQVIRELPRPAAGDYVDLLVEHTSAPEAIRGQVVRPVYDEIEDPVDGKVLSFDRWEPVV